MKLYTEEQMIQAYDAGFQDFREGLIGRSYYVVENITPIELPSDEEIKKLELEYAINFGTNMGIGFKIGCQWIKEQILNQNK